MLRSSNPILNRKQAFAPAQPGAHQGYPQAGYGEPQGYAPGYGQPGYGQPGYGQPGYQQYPGQVPQPPQQAQGPMTIDDVIAKSAVLFVVMMAVAAGTFLFMPLTAALGTAAVAAIAGFVMSMIVATRARVSPALTIVFSVVEGLFVGGFSKLFEVYYPGIVVQAIFGTFVAAALTFAAYKFLRVRVSNTVAKIVIIAMIAVAGASLLQFALSFAGIHLGFYAGVTGRVGMLAWGFSILCIVLAVFSLIMDFQAIESGVRNGAPASESWRAAYGLLVTMVWLYINILRVLSYIRR